MSSLPPGVTDSMCEPYNPHCGNCGHESEYHYDDGDELRNNKGEIISYCDKIGCHCAGFGDFEYEPDIEDDEY